MRFAVALLALMTGSVAARADAVDVRKMTAALECAVLAQASGDKMQGEAPRLGKMWLALALEYGVKVEGAYLPFSWGTRSLFMGHGPAASSADATRRE